VGIEVIETMVPTGLFGDVSGEKVVEQRLPVGDGVRT